MATLALLSSWHFQGTAEPQGCCHVLAPGRPCLTGIHKLVARLVGNVAMLPHDKGEARRLQTLTLAFPGERFQAKGGGGGDGLTAPGGRSSRRGFSQPSAHCGHSAAVWPRLLSLYPLVPGHEQVLRMAPSPGGLWRHFWMENRDLG